MPEATTPENFVINKVQQIAVQAVSHDEALKAILNGGGDILSTNYTTNIRPMPQQPQGIGMPMRPSPK